MSIERPIAETVFRQRWEQLDEEQADSLLEDLAAHIHLAKDETNDEDRKRFLEIAESLIEDLVALLSNREAQL